MFTSLRLWSLIFALTVSVGTGCGGSDGPELGFVKGTVTMDGKPFSGVMIAFMPQSGRASTAITDADGKYELFYKRDSAGAKVGPNTVTFQWETGVAGAAIPQRYADKSELKADVKSGDNVFDFDLKSDPGSATRPAGTPPTVID